MLANLMGKTRPADETNVEPGRLPAAADEAADRPGAEDGDFQLSLALDMR